MTHVEHRHSCPHGVRVGRHELSEDCEACTSHARHRRRRSAICRTAPLSNRNRGRDGAQRSGPIQGSREDIDHTFTPQVEFSIEDVERRHDQEVRIEAFVGLGPQRHGSEDREDDRAHRPGDARSSRGTKPWLPPVRRTHSVDELFRCAKAIAGLLCQRLIDGASNMRRHIGPHGPQARNRIRGVQSQGLSHGGADEWRVPHQHFIENTPQTVHVAPSIHLSASSALLGTHVGRGADCYARAGERLPRRHTHGTGDPEIRNNRLSGLQEDVLRLDISVHHTMGVRVGQRLGHVARDLECLLDGQLLVMHEPLAE